MKISRKGKLLETAGRKATGPLNRGSQLSKDFFCLSHDKDLKE